MKKEEKKTEYLEKFTDAFAENGIDRTSIKKMANAAEINEASIYQYFKNKDDIIVECVKHYFDTTRKEAFPILTDENHSLDYRLHRLMYYRTKDDKREKFIIQVLANPVYGKICSPVLEKFMRDLRNLSQRISRQAKLPEKSVFPLMMVIYSVLTADRIFGCKSVLKMQMEYLMHLAGTEKLKRGNAFSPEKLYHVLPIIGEKE